MNAGEPHYIRAGWLFDGSGQMPLRNVILRIDNGTIVSIGSIRVDGEDPSIPVSDFSRSCIIPPLVDCHVHLCMSGSTDPLLRRQQITAPYQDLSSCMEENIQALFRHGVLAVRDGGDAHGHSLRFVAENITIKQYPVTIKVAGRGWYRKGRYGRLLGCCPRDNESLAQASVRFYEGTDQLKIIQSGINSLCEFGRESAAQFSLGELKLAVDTAHQRGLKVMIHANGKIPVSMAIAAGCDSIEHGFFMGRENLQRMAESGTTWIATAHTMQAMGAAENPIPGADPDVISRTLEQQLKQLSWAREYGVKVAVGTDSGSCGVFHGAAMAEEMKLLYGAGYSLPETVQAATGNGAELLDIQTFGTIAVGSPASFLIVEGSPATLLSRLLNLQAVYVEGTLVVYRNSVLLNSSLP